MREYPFIGLAILLMCFAASTEGAEPAVPATQPSDAAVASSMIDLFLTAQDAPLLARATPEVKAAVTRVSLDDIRKKTVGVNGAATGPDETQSTVIRHVVGENGATFDIVVTVFNGKLTGLYVRPAK